ncbi:hypothetical protein HK100_009532 [Physocladia obscura]|uniref:Uncharacterized protein n=1 Tax=Physocladia obscura TaxID=109957 RepID=A0AAD5XHY1_9FUNG|nr:hypothetical protein HK100_009532 [Physocladia obscura]
MNTGEVSSLLQTVGREAYKLIQKYVDVKRHLGSHYDVLIDRKMLGQAISRQPTLLVPPEEFSQSITTSVPDNSRPCWYWLLEDVFGDRSGSVMKPSEKLNSVRIVDSNLALMTNRMVLHQILAEYATDDELIRWGAETIELSFCTVTQVTSGANVIVHYEPNAHVTVTRRPQKIDLASVCERANKARADKQILRTASFQRIFEYGNELIGAVHLLMQLPLISYEEADCYMFASLKLLSEVLFGGEGTAFGFARIDRNTTARLASYCSGDTTPEDSARLLKEMWDVGYNDLAGANDSSNDTERWVLATFMAGIHCTKMRYMGKSLTSQNIYRTVWLANSKRLV